MCVSVCKDVMSVVLHGFVLCTAQFKLPLKAPGRKQSGIHKQAHPYIYIHIYYLSNVIMLTNTFRD